LPKALNIKTLKDQKEHERGRKRERERESEKGKGCKGQKDNLW